MGEDYSAKMKWRIYARLPSSITVDLAEPFDWFKIQVADAVINPNAGVSFTFGKNADWDYDKTVLIQGAGAVSWAYLRKMVSQMKAFGAVVEEAIAQDLEAWPAPVQDLTDDATIIHRESSEEAQ